MKESMITKYGIVAFCFTQFGCVAAFFSQTFDQPYTDIRRQGPPTTTKTTLFQKLQAMRGPHVQPPRPNHCTYWVSYCLMVGEHPTDKRGVEHSRDKLERYLDAGISVFIDLTKEGQKPAYQELVRQVAREKHLTTTIEYHRLAIPDFGIPTVPLMKKILDTIDDAPPHVIRKSTYIVPGGLVGREQPLVVIWCDTVMMVRLPCGK